MKRFKGLFISCFLITGGVFSHAQGPVRDTPTGTALEQGLWWLYQLQYEHARKLFEQYSTANPKDPAGYFYKTAADWWQLAQEMDQPLPDIADRLITDYQDTVHVAGVILSSSTDPKELGRAALYSGGAEGLKGRWQVTDGQWVKAYFSGKHGHKLLKKAIEYDPTLYDAYLGLGIYDYYTDSLPGVQKVLAALLIHGDRVRGLQELQWAIEKGEHASVEARMFLIEIYTYHENHPEKGLEVAKELHREFPRSPAMHLAEIIDYYELKRWDEVTQHSTEFMEKSEKESPYYRNPGLYPAWYCLGVAALWGKHDIEHCAAYMNKILKHSPETSHWRTFANLRLGQVFDVQGKRDQAMDMYRTVLFRPDRWGSRDEARAYLKKPFQF
jgi:tetratricopeptide (TPR) repeat protein